MDVAVVVGLVAIPLLFVQIGRGRIHIRGGVISRDKTPGLFCFVAFIECAAVAVALVFLALYFKPS